MIRLFLTALLLCAISSCGFNPAIAKQRHRVIIADPGCNVIFPCEGVAPSARGEMIAKAVGFGGAQKIYRPRVSPNSFGAPSPSFGYSLGRPMRYIAGRLICAVNVNAALAERGIRGTGSAWAKSFLTWGYSAGGPIPGAVIVSSRRGGGHVAIVSRVENGVVYAWNATGGQSGWREIPYRHHVIDYRVPG